MQIEGIIRNRMPMLALAGLLVLPGLIKGQDPEDDKFYRSAFGKLRTRQNVQAKLERALTDRIREIDQACHLTAQQKAKLQLMGHGDISRSFATLESTRLNMKIGELDLPGGTIHNSMAAFQIMINGTIFHNASLLTRSLSVVLLPEQLTHYRKALATKQLAIRKQMIDSSFQFLEDHGPIPPTKREKLTLLLEKELKSCGNEGPYVGTYLLIQLVHMAEQKQLNELLNERQIDFLNQIRDQLKGIEPSLRLAGFFPEPEEPAAQKR